MTAITLSTHVLDLDAGAPAAGVGVALSTATGAALSSAVTDADGRIGRWPGLDVLATGSYMLTFAVGDWYAGRGLDCFYPHVRVEFVVSEVRHYHVPLLLNRHGYSTYRGS